MVAAAPLEPPYEPPREDHYVVLRGATWADYQRLQEIRGDRSAPRIAYSEGMLQIMSPSRYHESIKSMIGRLVEVWCLEHDIEFSTYGSWTLEDEALEKGLEPDECYVFGRIAEPSRPDLAIEVVWTSGGINKLAIYRSLGVREVWYWKRGTIVPHVLGDAGVEAVETSLALPGIDLAQLASFLDRATTSEAMKAFREALRGST